MSQVSLNPESASPKKRAPIATPATAVAVPSRAPAIGQQSNGQHATEQSPATSFLVFALPAAIVLASAPLLWIHVREMLNNPQYEYLPFIALGAGVLAWQRLKGLGELVAGAMPIFLAIMAVAAALQLMAIVIFSPVIAMVAFLFALLGLTYGFGGRALTLRMFPVWLFSWFTVPLPFEWDDKLVTSLQGVTARWSSRLLDTFGIMHLLSGNTVELPGERLFVEEACSGVQSLFACLAATAFFVVWSRYGYWRSTLLLLSAFGWVLVANATRVFIVTWLSTLGIDAATGIAHTLLGLGVFALTLGLMFSTDRLLEFVVSQRNQFWRRRENREWADGPTQFPSLQETLLGSRTALPLAGLYIAMLVFELVLMVPFGAAAASPIEGDEPRSFALFNENSMPSVWMTRPRTDFGTDVDRVFKSVHSRYWAYGSGRNRVYASIDFPFPKWHDLAVCYRGLGWKIDSKLYNPPLKEGDLPLYEIEMNQSPLGYGYLVFFLFDPEGKPMTPPSENLISGLGEGLIERAGQMHESWCRGGRQLGGESGLQYIQVQVFLSSLSPITETERSDARKLLAYTHEQLVETAKQAATQQASNESPR